MPELTAYQACSEVHDLWTGIAREAEKGRHRGKKEIPGPWETYCNACPCCQYVYHLTLSAACLGCDKCPMKREWQSFPTIIVGGIFNYCETHNTPYLKWSSGPKHYSCYDLSFFAWLIVELAEKAMERIKKEGEATP
ncbi:MAG: hypothetical protein KAV87_55650 [Desulfobacteraceae bacterium]|nr:hypothetical protein [Desulfobacteraceae bacterium]